MPIANVQDAREVESSLQEILSAPDADAAAQAIRTLFVETLDFEPYGETWVPLNDADPNLPSDARLLAHRDGFGVLYIPLDNAETNRITGATVSAAAKVIGDTIADEPLLLFNNRARDQLHFIHPDLSGAQPKLQRMVVHRNQPARTFVQQIANLWHDYGEAGLTVGQAISNAFSVQPVTDAFFKDYKAAYDAAVQLIAAGIGQADAEQFTQTLFNRLLFVHFVSRKGWLSFNDDTDYLNALWRDYQADAKASNFYFGRLTTLFFAGLNNPESRNLSSGAQFLIGNVPFLNGGLFEETDLDRRAMNAVPDAAVEPLITGLFNRYNFTVTEATPLDTEVAVDPEMLGKLFEETVNERHSNGAYYTPRPVVAFMCREAIKGYLAGRNIGGLDDAKIADLVDQQNPDAITPRQAPEIYEAIKTVKAVDPACGSGAFLLGMLQEIVALNETLFRAGHTPESLYQQKLDIITNNIYGVDKDGLAVSTAMLRLWLSLAVDYEGDGLPDPLPNLDLKLVVGDAIAGPDPQQLDLTQAGIDNSSLRKDIADYTTAHGQQKATLKQQVDAAKAELRSRMKGAAPAGVVEWRIDFADVMLNGGFDVVIANPPYVRQEEIGPNKTSLVKQYGDAVTARSDLYCYFYARGLQLLAEGGMHVFVCSNSWLDVGYGAKLKQHLLKNAHIKAVYESRVADQFETAMISTVVSVIQKTQGLPEHETRFVALLGEFEEATTKGVLQRTLTRNQRNMLAMEKASGKNGDKWGGKYLRAPDIYHHILNSYENKLVRLGDVATVRFGIKTGANKFFYLTPERIAEFGIEAEFLQRVVLAPRHIPSLTVRSDRLQSHVFICHQDKAQLRGTNALKYIEFGEQNQVDEISSVASRKPWYSLAETNGPLAMGCKIRGTARTFLNPERCQLDKAFYGVTPKGVNTQALCAVLNSTIAVMMLEVESNSLGRGLLEIAVFQANNLMLPNPQLLLEPAASVFNASDWDVLAPSAARRHIDEAVFNALELTAGERDAVYEGVWELVQNRQQRARGRTEPAGAGARDKPPFKVVPLVSGFAPGVNPDNLKEILYEMDMADYLEKERSIREQHE